MKLKRSQFTTTFVMIALFAVTAALQLLSAYGAMCIAWDPGRAYPPMMPGPLAGTPMFPYVLENSLLFQISNIVTWLGVIAWGFVIYCVLTQKKPAFLLALITSFISFVLGLIPALIADTNTFTEPLEIGSPHWARTFANFLVLIVLIIPPVGKSLRTFTATENRMTGSVANQIMMMSMFFFWISIVSFLGTTFMAGAHVIQSGLNVWELVEIQSLGAITSSVIGASMLGGGFIIKQLKPSNSVITSLEEN